MLDRMQAGTVPDKPHTALRDDAGRLRNEECLTRDGFEGPFTILYHVERPHTAAVAPAAHGWTIAPPVSGEHRPLARRHYRSQDLPVANAAPIDARAPLLHNQDVVISAVKPNAPYTHRDFRRPTFIGPHDEGLRELVVKRGHAFHGFRYDHSPLDVVGWDGTVYPWAFPILKFQPRVGQIHLPPTVHGTFETRGALICSFVPRPLDFHPDAIPCPYPHSSVACDEVIFYAAGNFTSRRGVGPGSLSHHPAGVIHGPHPGAYEGSIGQHTTDELAVMLDTTKPLYSTAAARNLEDPQYHASFSDNSQDRS